jgi:hypothetical protein
MAGLVDEFFDLVAPPANAQGAPPANGLPAGVVPIGPASQSRRTMNSLPPGAVPIGGLPPGVTVVGPAGPPPGAVRIDRLPPGVTVTGPASPRPATNRLPPGAIPIGPAPGDHGTQGDSEPWRWDKLGLAAGVGAAVAGLGALFMRKPGAVASFSTTVADDLFRLRQTAVADRAEVMEHVRAMPAETRTQPVQEAVHDYIESGGASDPNWQARISPQTRATLSDPRHQPHVVNAAANVTGMRLELSNLYSRLRKLGIPATDLVDPAYVHRRAVGHTPALDLAATGQAADPIMGVHTLPRTTSAMQERKFLGGRDASGNRVVVSRDPDTGTMFAHTASKTSTPVQPHPTDENKFIHRGRTYTIGNATAGEIERATASKSHPVTFHKNALANTADALVRMRAVARHTQWLDHIVRTPEWRQWATQSEHLARSKGWTESKLPQLKGWYVEPKLRAAFDDFYKPGAGESELLAGMRKVNQFATASMFWNPTPHIENVLGHWIVGRGFDWIKPSGAKSLITDGARAIRAVTTQNSDYRRLLKAGSGMIFGGVRNADFYRDGAQLAGMDIQRNPARWDPIARTVGLGPSDLVRAIYDGSRRTLWWANDVFMAQRVFELERKGMPLARAIKEAEKHIPNYRIPTEVLNSRMFSQLLHEPEFTVFSRYHYGVFNSHANMVRDLVSRTSTPQERIDAIGNMMALGLLTWVAYPALDAGLQKLFGDESAKKLRRGPAAFPSAVSELYDGERQWPELVSSVITVPAFTKLAGAVASGGHDPFTGRPITEPGSSAPQQLVQAGDYAASQLVQPYQLLGKRGRMKVVDRPGASLPTSFWAPRTPATRPSVGG